MALSPHTIKCLFLAAVPIGAIVLSVFIPPSESFKTIKTDQPWAKTFREQLFDVSANNEQDTGLLSRNLCAALQSQLKNGVSLQEGLTQMDTLMTQIGAHIGKGAAYINRGDIVYYFKPVEPTAALADIYDNTLSVFGAKSVGPKYSWLNPKWYAQSPKVNLESKGKDFIKMEPPYISVSFETPFPLLKEYQLNGLLQKPPHHISDIAQYANLLFVKSERRDIFDYTYAIDMRPWYQKQFGGDTYYNVDFHVSAHKNKDNKLDDLRITPTCTYPSKGVLYTALGTGPAADDATIRPPVVIPSCPEYLKWFQCRNDATGDGCAANPVKAPVCPIDNPDFPKADYGLVQ